MNFLLSILVAGTIFLVVYQMTTFLGITSTIKFLVRFNWILFWAWHVQSILYWKWTMAFSSFLSFSSIAILQSWLNNSFFPAPLDKIYQGNSPQHWFKSICRFFPGSISHSIPTFQTWIETQNCCHFTDLIRLFQGSGESHPGDKLWYSINLDTFFNVFLWQLSVCDHELQYHYQPRNILFILGSNWTLLPSRERLVY